MEEHCYRHRIESTHLWAGGSYGNTNIDLIHMSKYVLIIEFWNVLNIECTHVRF